MYYTHGDMGMYYTHDDMGMCYTRGDIGMYYIFNKSMRYPSFKANFI